MENKFSFGFRHFNNSELYDELMDNITVLTFVALICIFGLAGNGIVLWLLGFRIKRNPFSTYILNLTVSDFGFLLLVFLIDIILILYYQVPGYTPDIAVCILFSQNVLMYSSCQCTLIAMTIDRCMAVIVPDWYYCCRSPNFSTNVCGVIWVLLFFLCGIQFYLLSTGIHHFGYMVYRQYLVIASIGLPLMTISTLTLLITVCLKLHTHQRGKLSIVTLLILLFPVPFSFLTNALLISMYFRVYLIPAGLYSVLCGSLRSSVNLPIYLLVGRWKDRQFQKSMKVIFQRVFKEVEQGQTRETPL